MNIKSFIKSIISASAVMTLTAATFISCASTSTASTETTEKTPVSRGASPETLFIKSISNIELSVATCPRETVIGKAFSAPYILSVLQDGNPSANFNIAITYPSAKKEGIIEYTTETVTTDENGKYTFEAAVPQFAANTSVTFGPATEFTSESVLEAVEAKSVKADYKVKSNVVQKGCLLFVWDFNEKDRAINNNYDIQSEFRKRGLSMCGNAPINEKSDIGKPLSTLYKQNYEIVEDMYGYLIVGTIKFTKPVEQTEDESGYLCSLIAEISAINMKNGQKVFEQTFTNETVGANWTKATTTCKSQLATKVVDALIYGL